MELENLFAKYELFIIDMDGTLYYQSKLRKKMLALMLKDLFNNRHFFSEIYAVYRFRHLREELAGGAYNDSGLYTQIAVKSPSFFRLTADAVGAAIDRWIYKLPLNCLRSCQDERLIRMIKSAATAGKRIYIYSDYPVEEKAKALGLTVAGVRFLDASNTEVNAYKPSPAGIEYILNKTGVSKASSVMIGDRDDRDGLAAHEAGIDACILGKTANKRYNNG